MRAGLLDSAEDLRVLTCTERWKTLRRFEGGKIGVAKKRRPAVFSATKTVKANARARLGTPPAGGVIPDRRAKAEHGPVKHKKKVHEVIERAEAQAGGE